MTKPLRLRDAAGGNRKGKLTDEVDELVLADCDVWRQKKAAKNRCETQI